VADFGGDDAIVAEYLRDELLAPLSSDEVSFLLRTSVLDRLSGSVCDAVLGRRGSGNLLSTLARKGLLLVPLDRKDDSYRCHQLLREMLQADLRRLDPDFQTGGHSRAGQWYAVHGDLDRAVQHAVTAGDAACAAELIGARGPEYASERRNGTLRRWLSSFTVDQVAAHPALALAAATSHLMHGELDAVRHCESAAQRTHRETPAEERSHALESAVAILHATVAGEGIVRMGEDAARAYALEPEDSRWRSLCCLLEGVADHLTGDRDAAEGRLEEGVRRASVTAPDLQTLCLAQLALLAAEREDWESAALFTARATAQVDRYQLANYPTSALVFAVSAMVCARKGRVEAAQGDAREANRLLGRLTDFMPGDEGATRVALARAALRLSDLTGARQLIGDAARRARRTPEAGVVNQWITEVAAEVD
jgi:LuxR family maltose regulon positive regulatory protein